MAEAKGVGKRGVEAQRFAELWHHAPCGHVVTDASGLIAEVNSTLLQWTGYERDALIGNQLADLLEPGSRFFYETRQVPILRLNGEVREVSLSLRRPDGSAFPVLLNAVIADDGVMQVSVFDATERHGYERELLLARRAAEASEQSVRVLQNASRDFGDATTVADLAEAVVASVRTALSATSVALVMPGPDGALTSVAGLHETGAIAEPWWPSAVAYAEARVVSIGSPEESYDERVTSGLRGAKLEAVLAVPLLDAGALGASVPLGAVTSFFGRRREFDTETIELATALMRQAAQSFERLRLTAELEHLALRDPLTNLANRTLLGELLDAGLRSTVRTGSSLALMFLDLDGFKSINDTLGHSGGDAVLVEVAGRLIGAVRENDAIGRFGGDEFIIVCTDTDAAAAAEIADRIRAVIAAPLSSTTLPVTASVGVAVCDADAARLTTIDDLLIAADDAMYRAKADGKNRVSIERVGK